MLTRAFPERFNWSEKGYPGCELHHLVRVLPDWIKRRKCTKRQHSSLCVQTVVPCDQLLHALASMAVCAMMLWNLKLDQRKPFLPWMVSSGTFSQQWENNRYTMQYDVTTTCNYYPVSFEDQQEKHLCAFNADSFLPQIFSSLGWLTCGWERSSFFHRLSCFPRPQSWSLSLQGTIALYGELGFSSRL